MVATEVLRAPFKADSNPKELLKIADTQPAVGKTFSGFVSGETNVMRAFLDWDSVEAHEAFHATEAFPPFLADFQSRVAGEPALYHVEFKPSLEAQHKAQSAPVTEVVTFHFAGSPPADFIETALQFRNVLTQQPGFVEVALGVAHEEATFDDVTGHPVVVLIGWETEQQRRTFAGSEEYKQKNPGKSLEKGVLRGFEIEVVELRPLR